MPPIYETIASPFVPSSDQLFRPNTGDYSAGADGGIYLAVGVAYLEYYSYCFYVDINFENCVFG